MAPFELNILGCASAKPTTKHNPTSQILNVHGKYFMIDCGEGAQTQMQKMGLSMARIGHIFISHNHGDHVFGLPGLISTMALLGRTAQLHIHAPEQTRRLLDLVQAVYCQGMSFEIVFHPIDTTQHQLIFEDRSVKVWSIPLVHRVPTCGFLFRETPSLPHIRREMIDAFDIPFSQINNIKLGAGWVTEDGEKLSHEQLTTPATPPRSYAYCSDTVFLPGLGQMVEGVDLLFHEATYPGDRESRAKETFHSTAAQAAKVAHEAKAGMLCIGHYSARIDDEQMLLREAQSIFPQTILAHEGLKIAVPSKKQV